MENSLIVGMIVAVEDPAIHKVNPETRECYEELQPFEVTGFKSDGTAELKLSDETPGVYLRLTGGWRI
jgi:hypothetical protein